MTNEQDRRALLAIGLSMAVLMGWQLLSPKPPPPPPDSPAIDAQPAQPVPIASGGIPSDPASSPTLAPHAFPLKADRLQGEVASINGALRSLSLEGYDEAVGVTPIWTWIVGKVTGDAEGSWSPYAGGDAAHTVLDDSGALVLVGAGPIDDDGGAGPEGLSAYSVSPGADGSLTASRQRPDGLQIRKTYTAGTLPFTTRVQVELVNTSAATLGAPWIGVVASAGSEEPGFFNRAMNLVHPAAFVDGSLEAVQAASEVEGPDVENFDGPVSWFGVGDRYFLAAVIPPAGASQAVTMDLLPSGRLGTFARFGADLAPGERRSFDLQAYVGPKDLDLLGNFDVGLDESVEFGWFGFFSKLLLMLLKVFHAGVGNWGVSIILLTLTVKLVFYKLNEKAYASAEKMKLIQPEIQALKERYPDDQQRQSQEMMGLWAKHGVSPFGGCLPMLVQMPIFFALYSVMYYSVELYDTSFLYLLDLTAADPYGVVPTIYAVLLVLQQRMTPMANMDPAQQQMMKMMPFIFAFVMYSFPSGLVLYFCVNMFLTILQQAFIKRRLAAAAAT